ncbi:MULTISPECIES: glycosyltransferase family 1 protein [Lactobacillus]|jgi:glycosyltransferase involved in cell wall biosynthesis|uniref:glycosyltransferase family 1 protein n=1 Tax=Lactobacillus TaxID=1578 RepID=UPI00065F96F5|nr:MULTISPECIES: glycosyltransferase family 1 protein [Lactobacillus]OOK87393.1 glycosyl transferase family 4 [Lactobacillus gasseri]VEF35766.1 glycosyltransferase Family 4 candidate a-glycosyltransferase [Lactobacillus paragasseri]
MYKVLVFGITTNIGGIESFIMSYYKRFDRRKIHFDFLCNTHDKVAYEDELQKLDSKIYKVAMRSENPFKYKKEMDSFFKQHADEYDCMWVNVNSLTNIDYLKLAKKYGIRRRIIHSHNSQNMDGRLRELLHFYNRKRITKFATDFWACSPLAAKWFYEDDLLPKVQIIKNAIDLDRVKFDQQKRKNIRKEYNLENNLVIGNVGRLHFQKNQKFSINLLRSLVNKNPNIKMVFVGDGPDKEDLKEKVNSLNLRNNVIFAGIQSDISGWLSTFDLFLFPSKFEGLPIAGLEAQGNGLPVVASKNAIPKEAALNNNVSILSLDNGYDKWSENILQYSKLNRIGFEEIKNNFEKAGYEINSAVPILEKKFNIEE